MNSAEGTEKTMDKDSHIGEAGKHKGHDLSLLVDGTVYCESCHKPLARKSADKAWPPEDQSHKS